MQNGCKHKWDLANEVYHLQYCMHPKSYTDLFQPTNVSVLHYVYSLWTSVIYPQIPITFSALPLFPTESLEPLQHVSD